jgi:hypothetical protein
MLDRLMAEPGTRVICGDTTAEIAARLAGAELVTEPRPDEGWSEVPPVSRMVRPDGSEPVLLVTEGVVTMGVAHQRLAEATSAVAQDAILRLRSGQSLRHSLAGREDGASQLAHLLFTADKVRFLVGLATNPAQTAKDGKPLRQAAVRQLMEDLRAQGKIVVVEYV